MGDSLAEPFRLGQQTAPDIVQLLQITDCHIFATNEGRLRGLDTRQSFEAVSKAALGDGVQSDLILVTGDLSQDGSADSYAYLAQHFEANRIPTFWLPGNHDASDALRRIFSGKSIFSSKHILVGAWQILLLDSTIEGEVHGRVAAAQLDFLHRCLAQYADRHTLVCLHHQAMETGSAWIDRKGLLDAGEFREQLARHDNVRGVLWGHVHQEFDRLIDGVHWMSTPSSCVQFKPDSQDFAIGTEAPGYRRVRLNANGGIETTVHRIDAIDFDIDGSENAY